FFMIFDRLLSVTFGFNFQPYGPQVPIGFPIWGHILDGSLAIFAVWLWMKVLERAGGVKHSRLLKVITTLIIMIPFFLIPYVADSQHLIKNGLEGMIPFYVLANVAYVFWPGLLP
ncbi:MAG: hypothetical protein QW786_00475, partial [Candidatus Hadarchaeum sp.]